MRILNWKPEPKDERDYKFSNTFKVSSPISIPSQYIISIPEVWDQGDIGRCVGMSTAMATLYQSRVQSREIIPSPDFVYYNTRESEGTQNQDAGCYIRDAFKSLNKQGICKLGSWPMDDKKVLQKPSQEAYREALLTLATSYHRLNNLDINELKFCIASGRPFVFGFNVFSSFMYGNWVDTMPIPNKSKESLIGGHAVCLTPDNIIITESGVKTIDSVNKSDKVLTRNGFKSVKETNVRKVDENILLIHSSLTIKPLSVTKEHPILRQKSKQNVKLKYDNFEKLSFVESKDLEKHDVICSVVDQTEVDNKDISEDFARLLGYYIGDGNLQIEYYNKSIKSCKFRISYHRYCKKNIIEDVIDIIEKEYPGTKYSIWESKISLANNITFYNTELGKKILKYCGKAKEKTIDSLLQLPKNKQLEILKGWFKTDGSGEWLKNSSIHTSEHSLAHSLIVLLQRLGLLYSSTVIKSKNIKIRDKIVKQKESYTIYFHEKRDKVKMYYKDGMVYSRISKIEEIPYIGNVYNLQVDSVEEYVANNILVHNCAIGYSDQKKAFYIKNSWSNSWKDKGHFWMPYSYITSRECDDFWTLESISNIQLSNEFKIDITKIFESNKELSKLSEEFIVKIGIQFGLDVNLDYSKKHNLSILANYLKLEQ